jgi:CheY-like chemotaxis protein
MLLPADSIKDGSTGSEWRLAMIDDNPIEHIIMKKLCQKLQLFSDAEYFTDARIMLNLLTSTPAKVLPDIILLDLQMPEFDGWDFLRQFNSLYHNLPKPIQVYIFSSSVDPADKARSLAYHFVRDFISKPMKQETLQMMYQNLTAAA